MDMLPRVGECTHFEVTQASTPVIVTISATESPFEVPATSVVVEACRSRRMSNSSHCDFATTIVALGEW